MKRASATLVTEPLTHLPVYSRRFYQRASILPGIRGRVFIVGGTPEEAQAVRALGAKHVVVANPQFSKPWFSDRCLRIDDPGIQLLPTFAEEAQVEPGSIDAILSTCVIEHILDVPSVLSKSAELLRPGGQCLIHGGPVWTADRGHHVWVETADGTKYFFNERGDSQPVQAWEHLLLSAGELHERLVTRGVPTDHADHIIEYIYDSKKVNRLSPTQIEVAALRSPLRCVFFKRLFGKVPDRATARKLSSGFCLPDLGTWAVEFRLEKPG